MLVPQRMECSCLKPLHSREYNGASDLERGRSKLAERVPVAPAIFMPYRRMVFISNKQPAGVCLSQYIHLYSATVCGPDLLVPKHEDGHCCNLV